MQFKVTTDYAIRTVLYLATKNEVTTSGEISQIMGIPQKYLIKLLGELRQHKLVRVHMGIKVLRIFPYLILWKLPKVQ